MKTSFACISSFHKQTLRGKFVWNISRFTKFQKISTTKISVSKIILWRELIIQKQAPEVFCKKGVLRNFVKFTGKHLRQSLRPATLLKKRLWQRGFPVNFAKFLRTSFVTEHLRWLLLHICFSITIWKNCVKVKN